MTVLAARRFVSAVARSGALALLGGCALGLACGGSYDAPSPSPDAGAEASVDSPDATASSGRSSSIWLFGGRRSEWGQYSYDGFSSRVLDGGVLDEFSAAPTPPFRGLFNSHRRDPSAFWLLGSGIEDLDYGGKPPFRRVLLRAERGESDVLLSWRANPFADPSGVTNGAVAHVGDTLLYIGGTRTVDSGLEPSKEVYAAKVGPTTGIVQSWEVVPGVTLTTKHVRP